jgi:alkyldihydroxyacetonephosphate synthase
VLGLRAVLPDGSVLAIRPVPRRSTGPSLRDLLVGSEGTLGIITELTLRVWPRPEAERGVVVAFPSVEAALTAARRILQAELRPAVVRLYDAVETAERTEGLADFSDRPVMGILVFAGPARLAALEEEMALEIAAGEGGRRATEEPWRAWLAVRYQALSTRWQEAGYYNDTIEIAAPWSALPAMHRQMRDAVRGLCPQAHFGAHWSHVYPEGACQYMTLRLPPMDAARALPLHARLWDAVQTLALDLGGSIAHHHGAGLFRNRWMARELGGGLPVLQRIKDALDPAGLFNPGKLGLRAPEGAMTVGETDAR